MTSNINIVRNIINEDIQKEYGIQIGNNYDNIIMDVKNYVDSKVGKTPPKNMSSNEFIYLTNKKIYELAYPVIQQKLNNQKKQQKYQQNNEQNEQPIKTSQLKPIKTQQPALDNIGNNVFDPVLLKQY